MSDCPLLPLTIGQHSVPAGFDLKVTSINMILHIPLSQAAGRLVLIGRGRVREKENHVCSAPWIRKTQELCGQACCCCFKWDEFLWWTAGVLFFWQLMAYEGMPFRSSPVWQMEFFRTCWTIGRDRCLWLICSGYKWNKIMQSISFLEPLTECLWVVCMVNRSMIDAHRSIKSFEKTIHGKNYLITPLLWWKYL